MGKTQFGMAVPAAGLALSLSLSAANAVPITLEFNFVPNGTLIANTGDVATATSITSGAPLTVTQIVLRMPQILLK